MAKFELNIYSGQTGEVVETLKKNFIPVGLYIKFQKLNEKLHDKSEMSDNDLFSELQELFLETFPDLTKQEYMENVDTAEALALFRDILKKSTLIEEKN